MDVTGEQVVNDVHSRLNSTRVRGVVCPRDGDELRELIRELIGRGESMATCGGRHAMGGQQFATDRVLVDMRGMKRMLGFDAERGLAEFEAGAMWPEVIEGIHRAQAGGVFWGIRQKQTGADLMTLGGSLSANGHGRGLQMGPMVNDVESLEVVVGTGEMVKCSRTENSELFSLVIGGYGLFGVICRVTLRLSPRQKLRRVVDVLDVDDALNAVYRRVASGCVYGDFQYAIDPMDDSFLRRGVFACYAPAPPNAAEPDAAADLSQNDWGRLFGLAHSDKRKAFSLYAEHYLGTHGRTYWSDTMQLSTYISSYDQFVADAAVHSLVIGELYVPPEALAEFLGESRRILREEGSEDIYGTIRAIQPDRETFLAWAKREYACVIFNLRTAHTAEGMGKTGRTFVRLQGAAIRLGGSFFLTYHRHTPREQVEAAYPQFERFLKLKREYDPQELFVSDWYRHYAAMFA